MRVLRSGGLQRILEQVTALIYKSQQFNYKSSIDRMMDLSLVRNDDLENYKMLAEIDEDREEAPRPKNPAQIRQQKIASFQVMLLSFP